MIEVEGIANIQPAVAGLPERFLILRDEQLGTGLNGGPQATPNYPFWDASDQLRDSSLSILHTRHHQDVEQRFRVLAGRQCGR